jgi:glycosyltransferase involved in cell wall biosynthesis
MISDKFPPFAASGSARPFYFAKYLATAGFDVTVLAASPPAGEPRDDGVLEQLPHNVNVVRTPLLMTPTFAKLRGALGGRRARPPNDDGNAVPRNAGSSPYGARALLQSGRWWLHWHADWGALATFAGLLSSLKARPDVIWVTGPHFRNYSVGHHLAKLLGCPLVVDVRDPWTYGSLWQPETHWVAERHQAWAETVFDAAARVVFTSPLTQQHMTERFPSLAAKSVTITNGCDEDADVAPSRRAPSERCLFRYTGVLNPRRTPEVLLEALRINNTDSAFTSSSLLQCVGRSGGYESIVKRYGLAEQVEFVPPVPRAESLRLMRGADVNVLLQTITEGQDVIAGKVFEYLSAQRPILAVVDPSTRISWLCASFASAGVSSASLPSISGVGSAAPTPKKDAPPCSSIEILRPSLSIFTSPFISPLSMISLTSLAACWTSLFSAADSA